MNQLSLSFAIQASPVRAFSPKASGESPIQVPVHKKQLDANHRAATDVKGFGNLPIGVAGFTLALIAHQQDTCNQVVFGWGSACAHHHFQPLVLLFAQSHRVAVVKDTHLCPPFLGSSFVREHFTII
jgi:hypothetical protein